MYSMVDVLKFLILQVSPVTMRRLGSANLTHDIRGTRTNEFRHEQLYLSQCGWGMFAFRGGSEFIKTPITLTVYYSGS